MTDITPTTAPVTTAATTPGTGDIFIQMLPLVIIFFIFYFLLIRPQQKKLKAHQEMVKALKRGDKVLTNGGLIGKVSKIIDDSEIEIELAQGINVKLLRSAVTEVLNKTEPAAPIAVMAEK